MPDKKEGDVALAMVATSTRKLPDASAIVAAASGRPPRKPGFWASIFGGGSSAARWQKNILLVDVGEAKLVVTLVEARIPWSELEGPCATAWWWPEAADVMESHENHFLVALMGGSLKPVERRIVLTRAVSAVVRGSAAVGVYWGDGTLVHEPGQFIEQAADISADNIPGPLWIDVRVESNPDGSLRGFTTGLAPLGFLEIEVPKSSLDAQELMTFIGDTASYIVNGRVRIKDGETMGRTATEKYKVRHAPSMFERPRVLRMDMR